MKKIGCMYYNRYCSLHILIYVFIIYIKFIYQRIKEYFSNSLLKNLTNSHLSNRKVINVVTNKQNV